MNTTDMQGTLVKVGDRIAFIEGDEVKAFGTVTDITSQYTVDAAWEDEDGHVRSISNLSFVVVKKIEEKFTKEDEDALVKLLEKKRRAELQQKQATDALDHFICRTSPYGSGMIIDWIGRNAEALEPLLVAYNKVKIQK